MESPSRTGQSPTLPEGAPRVLAVGGELKSTVCLYDGREAILSEHLGDLSNPQSYRHFVEAIDRLMRLCDFRPEVVACDLHPTYLSTTYARGLGLPVVPAQHHHAHIASVQAEHGETGPVVGIACDGTGYGTDGAVWGCEIVYCEDGMFERMAHLEYFPLLGGDRAAVETWRPAAALMQAAYGQEGRGVWSALLAARASQEAADPAQLDVLDRQATVMVNAPPTSSLGRVFDAVSFLLGACTRNRHEAEAAMALEALAEAHYGEHGPPARALRRVEPFPYTFQGPGGRGVEGSSGATADLSLISFVPSIREIITAVLCRERLGYLAARFHETVARALAHAAMQCARQRATATIALSGGCFANRLLLARVVELLEQGGFRPLFNRFVPSGDGGIALGQAFVAAHAMRAV